MEKSRLAQLIQTFTPTERREIRKFLESPFFNSRADVLQLFDWFVQRENPQPEKTAAKRHLFGNEQPPDQELRLRMTYLSRLLERYIAQKELDSDPTRRELLLAAGLRRRNLAKPFLQQAAWLEKTLDEQPLRDANFYESKSQLHWQWHQQESAENATANQHLLAASRAADVAFLALKLRQICLVAAHKSVWTVDFQLVGEKELVEFSEKYFAADEPVIAIYLDCLRTLRQPEDESNFQNFKKMLLQRGSIFPPDEQRSLFLWAINFGVRRLNAGERRYFQEISDLYRAGLSSSVLLENGVLTAYTFSNVVAAGLQTGDLDWVSFFIENFKNKLEKQHRESATSFNLARLEFARRRFDAVLELLQKANYRDPLLNLAAKTLLLKTWFELGETEILHSHLDAMRNYIHRKRVLGYHRTNYLNILKFADKLLTINFLDLSERERFRAAVVQEEPLTEREWFLLKI